MRRSTEVRDTLLRFYEVFPAGDLESFAQIITQEDEGVVVIGTDPGQWTVDRRSRAVDSSPRGCGARNGGAPFRGW